MEEDAFLAVQGFTFIKRDPQTGIETFFKTNDDGSTTVYSRVNVDELLETNQATFYDKANHKLGDYVPLARFDDVTMQKTQMTQALQQGDRKYIKKILNDPDMAKFRTSNLKA